MYPDPLSPVKEAGSEAKHCASDTTRLNVGSFYFARIATSPVVISILAHFLATIWSVLQYIALKGLRYSVSRDISSSDSRVQGAL